MWKVSPQYPRDVVTDECQLVCTTYGPDAEENARWIVANQREIKEQVRDLQGQPDGTYSTPEATNEA